MPKRRSQTEIRDLRGRPSPDRDGKATRSKIAQSVGHAVDGFWLAAVREASVRNHLLGALAMVLCLVVVQPAPLWWGLCLLASSVLVALELFNTAIERLADHLAPQRHPAVGALKDIAAAAVAIASVGVLAMGIIMILDTTGAFS